MLAKILKLQNENKSFNYRVKPKWKENSFEITILLENASAWYADITEEQLTKLAEKLSQNVKDYYQNIKDYFCKPDDVSFDFKPSNDSTGNAEFIMKHKVGSRTILFLSINLKKTDFQQCVFNLLDECYEYSIALHEVLEKSKQKEIALENDKKLYQDKLIELVEVKANWEQEMYSNFIIVLNEKKKRIKFLTDLLNHKNIDPDDIQMAEPQAVSSPPSLPARQQKKLETISDSESNSEYETDNDDEPMNEAGNTPPKPSTSKLTLELDDDPPPLLSLPKFLKKKNEKEGPKKIMESLQSTATILTQETQNSPTQEPYLSTQEMIDRM